MSFNFSVVMKGSLNTVIKILQQDLAKIMMGKGDIIPLQESYMFDSMTVSAEQVKARGHQLTSPTSTQMLFFMSVINKEENCLTGLQAFCQLRWDLPTAKPEDTDWRSIFFPLFARSSMDITLPSKLTSKRSTAGISIQHIRMTCSHNPFSYSFLQHDWNGRPMTLPMLCWYL